MKPRSIFFFPLLACLLPSLLSAQGKWKWAELPPLPDKEGFAGMFAGVSGGALFCMGGANFPEKRPWEGGAKKWYSAIYKLEKKGVWKKLRDTLPVPLAYGVSVSAGNKIYLVGGSSNNVHTDKAFTLTWNGKALVKEDLPSLPLPLANMAGAVVGELIIVAGGSGTAGGPALKKCFGLDLTAMHKGWFELPSWPGPERTLPAATAFNGSFYLFSGERVGTNAENETFRNILQDAYSFTPRKENGEWTGAWRHLAPLPKGASAAASPVPVFGDGTILISGGVDAKTALHTDAATHPGIDKDIQVYNTKDDSWQLIRGVDPAPARVTLPAAFWNGQWVFISGEIKAGVRTPSVISLYK